MPCCKAEEFGWCEDQETITALDGQEYCIFHAPSDCPGKPEGQTFNNRVFSHIEEANRSKQRCDLGGTIFPGDIFLPMFNGGKKLPSISFKGATFDGKVNFQRAIFSGKADFIGAVFNNEALFQGAIFENVAWFTQARFKGNVDFLEATFIGMTYFAHAVFYITAATDFHGATFRDTATFQGVEFNGDVNFKAADFIKGVVFRDARFNGNIDYREGTFRGHTDFNSAKFKEKASFRKSNFHDLADFGGATFLSEAYFYGVKFFDRSIFQEVVFGDTAVFSGVNFRKTAVFDDSIFYSKAVFKDSTFNDHAYFNNVELGCINFEKTKFRDVSFAYSLIGGGSFFDAKFVGVADFTGLQTEWPLSFKDVVFKKRVTFERTGFGDDVDFTRAIFNDLTTFIGTSCWGKLRFDKAILKNWLSFSKPDICEISFDGCLAKDTIFFDQANLEQAKLFNAPIESMDFVCCRWPKDKKGRECIYDSLEPYDPKTLEDAYRRLKKVAKRDNDELMASAWHYKEKEICLQKLKIQKELSTGAKFVRMSLVLYKMISGFGEEPLRAFSFLLIFILAPLFILTGVKLWETGISNHIDPNAASQVVIDWLRFLPLAKVSDAGVSITPLKTFLSWLAQLFITFQFTLFAFALRNKFRR